MKVVTFNIRCDIGVDKENNFCFRKPLIVSKIQKERPDIICFQEVLPHVSEWLKETLTDYYIVGCARSGCGEEEQLPVAFRKDRINLMGMESFWLSPTPQVPGSRYEGQSECARICTELLLEDAGTKRMFRLFNIHLDHIGADARRWGLEQIMDKAEKEKLYPDAPVILTGDFNAEPDWEEMTSIQKDPSYQNVTEGIGITYHGYEPEDKPESIDYIYIQRPLACLHVEKWEEREGVVWLSDHYPICAELVWKDE